MIKNESSGQYKYHTETAQYYLSRYIEELRQHFLLNDYLIIKILEREIKEIKRKNLPKLLQMFLNKNKTTD